MLFNTKQNKQGKGVAFYSGALYSFSGDNMLKNIPLIARMIIIQDVIKEEKKENGCKNNSYYNTKLDSECEYCLNTSSWD